MMKVQSNLAQLWYGADLKCTPLEVGYMVELLDEDDKAIASAHVFQPPVSHQECADMCDQLRRVVR